MEKRACPFCIEGSVDSGGFTPWDEAIFVKCGFCDGTGFCPHKNIDSNMFCNVCKDCGSSDMGMI